MSNLKCPFCQQELTQITTSNPLGLGRIEMAVCKKCIDKGVLHIMPIWDWQELIRTRKALDVAVDALKEIEHYTLEQELQGICTKSLIAEQTLEQITTLEQKN